MIRENTTEMTNMEIATKRLRLVLESSEAVLARIEEMDPASRAEVSPVWLDRVRSSAGPDPGTHGFRMEERASGAVVGSCAFKGPPAEDGAVEIAYGVEPVYQRRGYATETAKALTAFALSHPGVRLIRAHTLPGHDASRRVLARCGFHFIAEVVDPEDGTIERWEHAGFQL